MEYRQKHRSEVRRRDNERTYKSKIEVLKHYSPNLACIKCGFKDLRALSIDHIKGGGMKHRMEIFGTGRQGRGPIYRWLKKNGYPKGFQILCANCNWIKRWENNEVKGNSIITKRRKESYYFKHRREIIELARNKAQEVKLEIFKRYSNGCVVCSRCGFNDIRALSIHHIKGGGGEHRRQINTASGGAFYSWLKRNNYPKGFKVFCMNCQLIESIEDMKNKRMI